MARLLFVTHNWNSVSETWIQRMLRILKDQVVLVAAENPDTKWNDEIDTFDLNASQRHFLPGSRLRSSDPAQRRLRALRKEIRRRNIDTVFVNYANKALRIQELWAGQDLDVFVHCHGIDIHFDSHAPEWPHVPRWSQEYVDAVVKMSEDVIFIANSRHTESVLLRAGVSGDRIRLKYFGVEVPKESRGAPEAGRTLNLLFIGRMVDFKGPDLVIRAFEIARSRGLDAQLVMAGDGPLTTTCELMILDSKYAEDITFLGPVTPEHVTRLLREADIFVNFHRTGPITRREEAFGVTLLEAMAYSLPVVTAISGGVPESILHGETGLLVEPGDIDAYVDCLLRLAADPEEIARMGANGRERVRQHFSLDQEERALKELFRAARVTARAGK